MSFIEIDFGDFVEDFGLPGLAIGVGAVILAPILGLPLAKAGKPLAKVAIKTSIIAYEKSKTVLAEAREALEELVAESKAELAEIETQRVVTVEANSS
jgi:hypothetical protein